MSSIKPFIQVASPHRDIIEGRLSMDVFAADLWQVFKGSAPTEYQDPDVFFQKTYLTMGLKNLMDVAEKRLSGSGGDPVIQIQTPFGGGKTHGLIALYHNARKLPANVVVIDGTALDAKEIRLWEEIERRLAGDVYLLRGETSPGKEKIIDLISKYQPVLILMDEVLEYMVRAEGIKIGDSNLAVQTLAFLQELTGAISTIEKALLVATLPSSTLEHYSEGSERFFQQIQKIFGRVEAIFTPVQEGEIENVIRRRLFQSIDEASVKMIVNDFIEYLERENLLTGDDLNLYRDRFMKSYPFKPEVIDILYKRWGSYPTFQRTRGVLRLLSMVIYDLKDKNIPFIGLGDFNLGNEEIKRELINHIGSEYDSIIAQDITSQDSGAKRVDKDMGGSYLPYSLGTKVSTTIFMMSFSGRGERGASVKEIKINSSLSSFPSSVIDDVINKLRDKLFYLSDEALYFSNQPNLNRILIIKEENIAEDELIELEKDLVRKFLSGRDSRFLIYVFPHSTIDVRDDKNLKLVILKDKNSIKDFIESCGDRPRVNRNTLIFLYPDESSEVAFYNFLRQKRALELVYTDEKLPLTEGQKTEVKRRIDEATRREYDELRKYYRKLQTPDSKERDLGIPTHVTNPRLDEEIHNFLKREGTLVEKISPILILDKYLRDKDRVETKNILNALYTTPGEIIITSENVLRGAIKEGVEKGTISALVGDKPTDEINFDDGEVITSTKPSPPKPSEVSTSKPSVPTSETTPTLEVYRKISLELDVPIGKLSDLVRTVNNMLSKGFSSAKLKVYIEAEGVSISKSYYEDKVLEAFLQANIKVLKENKD
ncbi:MAG: AAA family ATPase [bacterium]|nr:AAA family ATPase [bacterium]